jgi:nucleotide-binding universal stress UspA family protein
MSDKTPVLLVGIDGSDCSLRALDMALEYAEGSGASVICAYAMWLPGLEMGIVQAGGYAGLPEDYVRMNEEDKDRIFAKIDTRCEGRNLDITKLSDIAAPVVYLQNLIEKYRPKILFLGKQGRSALGDILVGSVSNKLVHKTATPVLLVP